jgi:hypothetical protein
MPKPTSKSRQELRSRFVRNAIPTETDFADLIAASLNQADDGVLKLPDQPLGLVRQKPDQPVLRFFADPAAEGSVWQVQLGAGDKPGFGLAAADGKLALFVDGATGNVGIGTGAKKPEAALHVAGNLKVEAGSITLDRDQKVFFTDNGQIGSRDQYHQLLFRCKENITELREWGDLWFSAGANIENTNQPKMIVKHNGLVGIGTAMPFAKLQVTGNVSITSAEGQNFACKNYHMAPGSLTIGGIDRNYGGGTKWNNGNAAGLLLETIDNTEIAIHDSEIRLASFMYYESANNRFTIGRDMGWGAISTVNVEGGLQVIGQTNILTGTNPIRFSSAWTGFPDDKANGAEISNDTKAYKTLMIIGNKSNGGGRRVSIWDILEVNGRLEVRGDLKVNGKVDSQNARIQAIANDSIKIASDSWTDMPKMIVTAGIDGPVLVLFKTGGVQGNPGKLVRARFRLLIDNIEKAFTLHEFHNEGWELRDASLMWLEDLTPGNHEFKVQWRAEAGTVCACLYNDLRSLIVVKL